MRLSTFAVWAYNLNKEDLFIAVKLQSMLTYPNNVAIETSQLYCYAISLLIKGYSSIDAFNMTKTEIKNPIIIEWFEKEIEAN
jgi:hypothetical protein